MRGVTRFDGLGILGPTASLSRDQPILSILFAQVFAGGGTGGSQAHCDAASVTEKGGGLETPKKNQSTTNQRTNPQKGQDIKDDVAQKGTCRMPSTSGDSS